MSKHAKNISQEEIILRGIVLAPGETFTIPSSLYMSWGMDEIVAKNIIDGVIQIYSEYGPIDGFGNQIRHLIDENKKTSTGDLRVSTYEPEGDAATIVTHNFADKCSWFNGSVEVLMEELSTSDNLLFSSSHIFWIDLESGRLYDEDTIMASTSSKYRPKIYIDEVLQTSGYSINYANGSVSFLLEVTGTVKASYHRADKSYFKIKPNNGKILSIKSAEVQFASDTVMNGSFIFEAWVDHPSYGMIPVPGTKISYKNAKDFISACNEGQGMIPKWGELTEDIHVFPFKYARPKPIKYSDGVEIRVYCKDDLACGGQYATATFYVTVDNE